MGSITSVAVALTVLDAPAIAVQPLSITALEGGTVVFSVTALGKSPLAYQWYADCTRPIAGSTLSSLRLKEVTPAYSGNYCVAISNIYGSTFSQPATLRVLVRPALISLTQSPQGFSLTFSTITNLL